MPPLHRFLEVPSFSCGGNCSGSYKDNRHNLAISSNEETFVTISDETSRLTMLSEILSVSIPSSLTHPIEVSVEDMDDAALIHWSDSESLVVASDFVRGPHFYLAELGLLNYFDLGFYLIIANLSDLAAMGARPIGMTTIVRYDKSVDDESFKQIFEGIKAAADEYSVPVIGGDIGGYVSTVLAATSLGSVDPKKTLLRRGARPGDLLCVTGTIGLPITALLYFKEWKPKGSLLDAGKEERLLASWKRPKARVPEGMYLSEARLANACQDISDGLKATVEQMAAASNCSFELDASTLPIHSITKELAIAAGVDPVTVAMSASVDFELLFCASQPQVDCFNEHFRDTGISAHVIGRAKSGQRNVLVREDGSIEELPGIAWRQQTSAYLKDITKGGK